MTGVKAAVIVLLAISAGNRSDSASEKKAAPPPPERPASADLFTASVRPVLAARCAPCHEPGGKMYAKLPFDRPETIADHSQAILRRLKGSDREAVETWLASLPAAK